MRKTILVTAFITALTFFSTFNSRASEINFKKNNHDNIMMNSVFTLMPDFKILKKLKINPQIDLRSWCPQVYNQGRLGSCTAFASAKGVLEIERRINNKYSPSMSAHYLYYYERKMQGDVDSDHGASINDAAYVMKKRGVCTEEKCPYNISGFNLCPSVQADKEAIKYKIKKTNHLLTIQDVFQKLNEGHPVMIGIAVFQSFASFETVALGTVNMPEEDDIFLGGHAICLVGYDKGNEVFIARNSWGEHWGDDGYLYIPFKYILNFSGDAWSIEV